MSKDKLLASHTFVFNKGDNSGESLHLTTEFFANGDPITENSGVYINQELTLQSYSNAATLQLTSAGFTSDRLRELADQLDACKKKIVFGLNHE